MRGLIVIITAVLILFSNASCESDFEPEYRESVAVEGWIDAGGFPVVILTRTVPMVLREDRIGINNLSDYIIKFAKVTVSDGEDEVVLTGKSDDSFFPPYVYTTSDIRGVAGKQYRLLVEYKDVRMTAFTSIPETAPEIEDIICRPLPNDTTLNDLVVLLNDDKSERRFYKTFYLSERYDNHFLSSYLGVADNNVVQEQFEIPILRGSTILELDGINMHYNTGEDIVIKVATIDSVSYRFWEGYENIVRLGKSSFLPTVNSAPGNIEGGIGSWCGYNSIIRHIKVSR